MQTNSTAEVWSLDWPAPAKLNLMLRILGRRADGYHNLQTVFQFLAQGDTLDFRLRNDGQIRRITDLPDVSIKEDLTLRAARLLQQATGCTVGVDIQLHKQLPFGGGLGGGSSDAATVLVALNQLWNCHLTRTDLAALALQLGADVPVFVQGQAAWAEGVGERLQPLSLPEPYYLVLIPPCTVSTAKIFSDQRLTRNASAITITSFMAGYHENHCLPVVLHRFPPVRTTFEWLQQFAPARLTGTGSCVFAEFAEAATAHQLLQQAPCTGFVAQGLNQSPLIQRLKTSL